jgi:molybdenum cofactor synthesis domain-containing protein
MPNDTMPTAAMLVIGDEILSGRTRDANMHHLAKALTDHGIRLEEVRIVADVHARIVAAIRTLSSGYDHLFTSGGIGPTHDDITADAVAEAMGATLGIRDDARAILQAHYDRQGMEMNAARLRMARMPDGATLIDNPISAAPGFTLGNVHVMAGVPVIFEAMLAGVLPTLTGGPPVLSQSLRVRRGEGDIAGAWANWPRPTPRSPSAPTRSSAMVCTARTSWCAARTARRSTGSWRNWPACSRRPDDRDRRHPGAIRATWPPKSVRTRGPLRTGRWRWRRQPCFGRAAGDPASDGGTCDARTSIAVAVEKAQGRHAPFHGVRLADSAR